jgi:hypothetical protein
VKLVKTFHFASRQVNVLSRLSLAQFVQPDHIVYHPVFYNSYQDAVGMMSVDSVDRVTVASPPNSRTASESR